MSWQETYKKWQGGADVKKTMPKVTFYNHRAIIMRAYGSDIAKKNFDLVEEIEKMKSSLTVNQV